MGFSTFLVCWIVWEWLNGWKLVISGIANKNCNLFFPNWQVTPLLSTPCRFFHHLLRVFHLESWQPHSDWSTEKFIATKHLKKALAPHDAWRWDAKVFRKKNTYHSFAAENSKSHFHHFLYREAFFLLRIYDGSCVFWLLLCQASLIRDNCVKRSSGSSPSSSSQHQQKHHTWCSSTIFWKLPMTHSSLLYFYWGAEQKLSFISWQNMNLSKQNSNL